MPSVTAVSSPRAYRMNRSDTGCLPGKRDRSLSDPHAACQTYRAFLLKPSARNLRPSSVRIHIYPGRRRIIVVHPRRRGRWRRRHDIHGSRSRQGASDDGPRDESARNSHKTPGCACATGPAVVWSVMISAPGITDGRHDSDHNDRKHKSNQNRFFHNPSTYRDSVMLCCAFVKQERYHPVIRLKVIDNPSLFDTQPARAKDG